MAFSVYFIMISLQCGGSRLPALKIVLDDQQLAALWQIRFEFVTIEFQSRALTQNVTQTA